MDNIDVLNIFHPVVKGWFLRHIGTPSLPQVEGWPQIQSGKNVLIASPTGSGKTLAAFLESINRLLEMGIRDNLPPGVFILYVSPLKALNNDINKNLEIPLQGIRKQFQENGNPFPDIQKAVRTGDTSQYARQQIIKKPPHILITTPESLYLMLTSTKSRGILKNIHYLIVDEIHTLLGTKRGVHLALSMERLETLAVRKITRIGLSATVNPLHTAARFLGGFTQTKDGFSKRPVEIIAPSMERNKELKIHVPVQDFRVPEQGSVWPDIYNALVKQICKHTSTIVFVNNRATAERVAANVNALADREICCPHHGSISKRRRLDIENRFKSGELRCIIATSTLELGIDVGSVDFIVQISAPPSVSSGVQRLGRAGHRLSATSSGEIIPKTRGDLLKAYFLAGEMLEGHIEKTRLPINCLDILAQHIVSMCCTEKWTEEDLFDLVKQASSYQTLHKDEFQKVLAMLSGDYEHMEDIPAKPRILWDRQHHTLEGTSYSRMLAISSGGTIPDRGTFAVYLEDHKTRLGELDEEFVFEARIGDRFMLGSSPWVIRRIDKNKVIVAPCTATGAKTPFWKGDGIGASYEQSVAFGRFVRQLADKIEKDTFLHDAISSSLLDEVGALNVRNYLLDQQESLHSVSNDCLIVVEHTSSSDTDKKMVIHAHFGGRVNSVLAMLFQHALDRHVHCKAHTAYTDDAILIHFYGFSDTLCDVFSLISSGDVERVCIAMLSKTSRFALTFRYNAYRALMMGVRKYGQRLPLWIQRLRSVDALENAQKYMDHPLIIETMRECLEDILDIPHAIQVLQDIEKGHIQVLEKHTWFPSPFASEILFQFQQEFLYMEKSPHPENDDYPVISGPDSLNLSYKQKNTHIILREDAVQRIVQNNNTPYKLAQIRSSNELHSFLLIYGDIKKDALTGVLSEWICELLQDSRVVLIPGFPPRYIAVEEMNLYGLAENVVFPTSILPFIHPDDNEWTPEKAATRILRRYARYNSPFTKTDLLEHYPYKEETLSKILAKLQAEGHLIYVADQKNYYHSTIYERAVHLTVNLAADAVSAREPSILSCLLADWQKIGVETVSPQDRLLEVITQLEGLFLPAQSWENIVFPARVPGYTPGLLDKLCTLGEIVWRILPDEFTKEIKLAWFKLDSLAYSLDGSTPEHPDLPDNEATLYHILRQKGASFTHVLSAASGIPTSSLLDILHHLVSKGLVVNDAFQPVRYFLNRDAFTAGNAVQKARRIAQLVSKLNMGRWELAFPPKKQSIHEFIRRCSARYGMITKEIVRFEHTPFTWPEIYEALKQMEYAGGMQRGYFFKGISGIQFMLPNAVKKLDAEKPDYIVLNACDPAQAYGRVIPRPTNDLPFTCVPGTAVVLFCGKPVLILERSGEKIRFNSGFSKIEAAVAAFRDAFQEKRIWSQQKKVVVKFWPENRVEKEILKSALRQAGFLPEVDRMVLWRSH